MSVAATSAAGLARFIVPLASAAASNAERVGPKAANLAALARCGLPTPGGFCLTADAYRDQIAALGLTATLASYGAAEMREQRRLSVEIRLALYEQPIAPEILEALLDAWRAAGAGGAKPFAVRSSALIEDRKGANFAASSKASSASPTRLPSSRRCAPAGPRCGPPMPAATWKITGSARATPRWRC
jgi:phosphoenolpyruvate synthase/pyruvate phosphate dikinase